MARIDDSPGLQLDDLDALNEAPRGSSVPSVRVPEGLAACLSEVGIAVIETDGAHAVRSLNTAAERLTGWPRSRALGKPLDRIRRHELGDPFRAGA